MNVLDFSEKELVTLGDIHGEFKLLLNVFKRMTSNKDSGKKNKGGRSHMAIDNKVFVICGDCGFGFEKYKHYITLLHKLNEYLKEHNSIVIFIRGNHDNPNYFNTNDFDLGFENIILIPDYTVIKTKEHTSLCVGGAVSYDREWRINETARRSHRKGEISPIFWEDEKVFSNPNLIADLADMGLKIDSIMTHTAPLRNFFKNDEETLKSVTTVWEDGDKKLAEDIANENALLEKMFFDLKENGHELKWWCCGHFHMGFNEKIPNTETRMIVMNIFDNNSYIYKTSVNESVNQGYISDFNFKKNNKINKDDWGSFSLHYVDFNNPF